ncbi:MAG: DsbA family protein [Chloroflexi bacterium]|nr:DsbA family protein [Chloroflexota bacterium]
MPNDSDIDFYFDPTCGWAWRTSIWMRRVAAQRALNVTWIPFSLAVVNSPEDYNKDSPGHVTGVALERALVMARRTAGNAAVDRLYVAYGNVLHGEVNRQTVLEPEVQARCLESAGLPSSLVADALADPTTEEEIVNDTKAAIDKLHVFGVPTLAFQDSDLGFFGPVINCVPEGEDALRLWDFIRPALRVPFLFEFKRTRTRADAYAASQYAD